MVPHYRIKAKWAVGYATLYGDNGRRVILVLGERRV